MQLAARWTNKEAWTYHIEDTGIVRECIQDIQATGEANIERIEKMVFKPEWMEDSGEGNPPNYDFLKACCDEISNKVMEGELRPGLIERRVFQKAMFYALVKFKNDSAYREIMGGWLTVTVLDPDPWMQCKTKEERVAYLNRMVKWLDMNYHRERTKPWVLGLLSDFIKRYQKSAFVEAATNWFYDKLVENRENWVLDPAYDPKTWYPIGRGYIQNKIRGGRG